MGRPRPRGGVSSRQRLFWATAASALLGLGTIQAQQPTQAGPYLAHLIAGGPALVKPLPTELAGTSARTEEVWVRTDTPDADAVIAGIGDPNSSCCYFELRQGRAGIGSASGASLLATSTLSPNVWHLLALSDDGQIMTLYIDGNAAGTAHSPKGDLTPEIQLAPDPAATLCGSVVTSEAFPYVMELGPPRRLRTTLRRRPISTRRCARRTRSRGRCRPSNR